MTVATRSWEQRLLALAYEPLKDSDTCAPTMADLALLDQAYAHCAELTREHSKTFHMASALLPGDQRRAARALYAFCRITDDLVDNADGDPTNLLRQWRRRALDEPPREDDLVPLAWADTCARYQIPVQYGHQLIDGVARDVLVTRYATFDDLAEYAYGVASTVGLMAMHIIGFAGDEAIPYAVKLGVALQLTNILRDVGEDWQNGRLYLPLDELARFSLSEDDVAAGRVSDRWQAFMQFQIERNRRLYAEAMPGLARLDRRGRFAIAAAAQLYEAILEDIEAYNGDVFSRRSYVSWWDKVRRLPGIWRQARRAGRLAIMPDHS